MTDYSALTPQEIEALMDGPGMVPPAGVIPDFELGTKRNDRILALYVVCLMLVGIIGLLRVYSRIIVSKKIQLEDCKYSEPLDSGLHWVKIHGICSLLI